MQIWKTKWLQKIWHKQIWTSFDKTEIQLGKIWARIWKRSPWNLFTQAKFHPSGNNLNISISLICRKIWRTNILIGLRILSLLEAFSSADSTGLGQTTTSAVRSPRTPNTKKASRRSGARSWWGCVEGCPTTSSRPGSPPPLNDYKISNKRYYTYRLPVWSPASFSSPSLSTLNRVSMGDAL